jgi:Mg2+ and Co2+ transporter CorA
MNAESMPELPWKWGYAMALGLIAAAVAPPCRRSRRAGRL